MVVALMEVEETTKTWTYQSCVTKDRSRSLLTHWACWCTQDIVGGYKHTFSCLLMTHPTVGDLEQGKKLHSRILYGGLLADLFVGSCLVDMHCKWGSLEDAHTVFDQILTKNVVA